MATKSQLLKKGQTPSALAAARGNILSAVLQLSTTQQDQVFLGIWSVKDLMSHLAGWDDTNLEAIKSIRKNQLPSFYQYRDHDWHTYDAILVDKYKPDSFKELLASVKRSHEKLIDFVQGIPAEELNRDFDVRFHGYKVTIRRLLEAETKDEQTHYKQISDFFKEST